MPTYRYLLCDLLTDQVLAALPLTGVTFDRRISRTGALSGTLYATDARSVEVARLLYSNTGRAALWVYRDAEIWWGGIPWTVTPSQGQRGPVQVSVNAATFDSYAHHRVLYADKVYSQVDQGALIPDLWRTIQSDPRGNIGVQTMDQPTGVLRDRTYLAADQAYVGRLIEDLGDVIDGPEHTIDTYTDGSGARIKSLRVAQTVGLSEPRAVFQRAARGGGRLLEWGHTADAVDSGTTFIARGDAPADSTAGSSLSTRLYADDLLTAGWPLLDVSEDRSGTTDPTVLLGWAQTLKNARSGAIRTSSYRVQVGDTGWSPNRLGDPVRIKQDDLWHSRTEDADVTVRPVGVQVTAADRGTPETVNLLFGD